MRVSVNVYLCADGDRDFAIFLLLYDFVWIADTHCDCYCGVCLVLLGITVEGLGVK